MKKLIVFLFYFQIFFVYGHGGEKHPTRIMKDDLQKINEIAELYQKDIYPIFKNKCFDCHSPNTLYPWYYKVPVVKQLIDHDISEAKEHLDFGGGFPFKGHHLPSNSLKEIEEVINKDTMPPTLYLFMHKHAKLTEDEKQKIINWIKIARKILESKEAGGME